VIGISTEAGELLDAYKKHIYYKRELDLVNVKEEIGDIMWYIANFCTVMGIELDDLLRANLDKLKLRYPEKFDSHLAVNRDLDAERNLLSEKL
jgi:NTP pyrophosphatase (non-canonical NTP hydrolase)